MARKALTAVLLLFAVICPTVAATTVMIDPGHGGADPGAIGHSLQEKDVALDIALRLKEELEERGYGVLMTRMRDEYLTLQQRVDMARNSHADLFVSIHANAHTDKRVNGTLVLYYDHRFPQAAYPASREMAGLSGENAGLAQSVLDGLLAASGTVNRGIVPSSVYVIRNGKVPSVLVETAFISNYSDAELLASAEWRAKAARGIAEGIAAYTPPAFSDIAGHWARGHVEKLKKLSLVGGFEGRFEPDRPMTRAEFLVLADRVFGYSARNPAAEPGEDAGAASEGEPADGNPSAHGDMTASRGMAEYADLPASHWAFGHLGHAVRLGIARGYEDGLFRPDGPLSRAEMAVMIGRIARLDDPGAASLMPFADVPTDSWYAGAVQTLYGYGLVGGVTQTEYKPGKLLTRAEAAAVIDRFLQHPAAQPALGGFAFVRN